MIRTLDLKRQSRWTIFWLFFRAFMARQLTLDLPEPKPIPAIPGLLVAG